MSRELFVVLPDLKTRFSRYQTRVKMITIAPAAQVIANVNVFYQKDNDLALLCLAFETGKFDPFNFEALIHRGTEAGLAVIDPERFSNADRVFFYQDYLRRFSIGATDLRSPSVALLVLGRQLGLMAELVDQIPTDPETFIRPRRIRAASGSEQRRALPKFIRKTRATRPLSKGEQERSLSPHDQVTKKVDSEALAAADAVAGGDGPVVISFHSDDKSEAVDMDLGPAGKAAPAKGKGRRSQRLDTVPALPSNRPSRDPLRLALPSSADPNTPVPPPDNVRKKRVSSVPPVDRSERFEPVRVRYQRGDTWMPARLRNLTTKDVRLAVSAAPPAGSTLRVAISIGAHDAVLTGTVVEVVNTEGSTDGSTTFRCEFREVGKQEQSRLIALLREAKRSGLSLTPPPARRHRRFAISWPLTVMNDGQRFNASALDISEHGLFLATSTMLRSSKVLFGMPLDREGGTVRAHARIARTVDEQMARNRGLALGYGLQIDNFHVDDHKQFADFLLRVRSRSQRHILVAGDGGRTVSLAECFRAAGYAVSKANSVEMMLERTQFESNAPDLAMMDAASLSTEAQKHFRDAFRENGVPVLLAGDQSPPAARDRLDQIAEI